MVDEPRRPTLTALHLGDPADRWEALGFTVVDDTIELAGVRLVLGGSEPGIGRWSLAGIEPITDIDGLPTTVVARPEPAPTRHPNGATQLDHVVVTTPDFDRTATALEMHGMPLRRIREVGDLAAERLSAGLPAPRPGDPGARRGQADAARPGRLLGARRRPPRPRLASQPSRERRGGGAEAGGSAGPPDRDPEARRRARSAVAFMSPDRQPRPTCPPARTFMIRFRRPELIRSLGRSALGQNRPKSALRWRHVRACA